MFTIGNEEFCKQSEMKNGDRTGCYDTWILVGLTVKLGLPSLLHLVGSQIANRSGFDQVIFGSATTGNSAPSAICQNHCPSNAKYMYCNNHSGPDR